MIIWGSTGREIQVAFGRFFCPSCRAERDYRRFKLSRYFTLYFIPLFETQKLGEFVRCDTCKDNFKTELLALPREAIEQSLEPWTCAICQNRNGPEQQTCLVCCTEKGAPPRGAAPAGPPDAPDSIQA